MPSRTRRRSRPRYRCPRYPGTSAETQRKKAHRRMRGPGSDFVPLACHRYTSSLFLGSGLKRAREHEVVVAQFGDAKPEILVRAELEPPVVDASEVLAFGCKVVVEIERRFLCRFHHGTRKWAQLCSRGDHPSQRFQ